MKWLSFRLVGMTLAVPALAWSALAFASSFYLHPVSLVVSADKRTALLSVKNTGASPSAFRIRSVKWTQVNGGDVEELESDLISSPPAVTIAPGVTQLVRIGPRAAVRTSERAYRVLVEEIPIPGQRTAVQMPIRFNLPLYLAAAGDTPANLTWRARRYPNGRIALDAVNSGSTHAAILEVSNARDTAQRLPLYGRKGVVLGNSYRTWEMPASFRAEPAQPLILNVRTESGDSEIRVVVFSA